MGGVACNVMYGEKGQVSTIELAMCIRRFPDGGKDFL